MLIKTTSLNAISVAGYRSAIAAIVILLWVRRPRPTWTITQFGTALSYAATVILFVWATKLTTAANAIALQYTAPIWVLLFNRFFRNLPLNRIDGIAATLVMLGICLFFVDAMKEGAWDGNLLAIASGMAFALVALFSRAQNGVSVTESILLGNVITAFLCLPFMEHIVPRASDITNLLLLGVFQLGISYILYAWAMKHVSAMDAVLITMLEPLLNPLWVYLGTGEIPDVAAIFGMLLILITVTSRSILYFRSIQPL